MPKTRLRCKSNINEGLNQGNISENSIIKNILAMGNAMSSRPINSWNPPLSICMNFDGKVSLII